MAGLEAGDGSKFCFRCRDEAVGKASEGWGILMFEREVYLWIILLVYGPPFLILGILILYCRIKGLDKEYVVPYDRGGPYPKDRED